MLSSSSPIKILISLHHTGRLARPSSKCSIQHSESFEVFPNNQLPGSCNFEPRCCCLVHRSLPPRQPSPPFSSPVLSITYVVYLMLPGFAPAYVHQSIASPKPAFTSFLLGLDSNMDSFLPRRSAPWPSSHTADGEREPVSERAEPCTGILPNCHQVREPGFL